MSSRPRWQIPDGVHPGTWDYLTSKSIADTYDKYFAEHPLLKRDLEFVLEHLPDPRPTTSDRPIIVDLGCGTARLASHLLPLGYRCVNVDLSWPMLTVAQTKLSAWQSLSLSVRGNMVQLDFLRSSTIDGVVCLFSSLGMIRGRACRRRCLHHCRRILRPNGVAIFHVHNLLRDLWEPGGWRRLSAAGWARLRGAATELGDTIYSYRNIPSMFMHRFRRGELYKDLLAAGFSRCRFYPLVTTADRWITQDSWFNALRAGGFFVVARP